jgi:hypothetical protein
MHGAAHLPFRSIESKNNLNVEQFLDIFFFFASSEKRNAKAAQASQANASNRDGNAMLLAMEIMP